MKERTFKTIEAAQEAVASGRFGSMVHLTIRHDDGCDGFDRCSCTPDYVVEPLTVESWLKGQTLQAQLLKDRSN